METVITDDGARLWAARSGPGAGPWTTDRFTADLDAVRRPGTGIVPTTNWHDDYERGLLARLGEHPERLARWRESPRENLARAVLQWSVEFQDSCRARRWTCWSVPCPGGAG
ncbi:hypothetical protein [Streptomyces sp. NPDC006668]|uniref:hypothetical protein n=1 Tax=Streptomyces sp. NPDC006668 TaxID=3156903 RepID=UPI003404718A